MSKRTPTRRSSPSEPRFTWRIDDERRPDMRFPGTVAPRTIARCVERGLVRGDLRFLMSALPANSEFSGLSGSLEHISDYAVEFALQLHVRGTKRAESVRLVVARNDRDRAELLRAEIRNLQWLAARLPKHSAEVRTVGAVFQPDRYGRASHHRRLPAYITAPLTGAETCNVANSEQLAKGEHPPRLVTRSQTDHFRRRVFELCLRAYDPEKRRGLPPPDLSRGALRLVQANRGQPEPFIAGCLSLWDRIDGVTLIHRLTGFEWRERNVVLPLLPSVPEMLLEACVNALGKKGGHDLLSEYLKALEAGRYPEHRRMTKATIAELLSS